MKTYTIFSTEAGWLGVVGSAAGLVRTTLPQPSAEAVRRDLGNVLEEAVADAGPFSDLVARLIRYFQGQRIEFRDALDLGEATSFYGDVWRLTRAIPYGQTRSYAWLAREVGRPRASRAVGQAMARNPVPIVVPCHRVLGSDGGLCGFGGGLDMKQRLLELEGRNRGASAGA